jgi:hypothetical protein
MTDEKIIQEYINNFRRRFVKYLQTGIGIICRVYPALSGGTILEFTIGPGIKNDDVYNEASPTVNDALSRIKQQAFGGHLSGFVFSGTNVIIEGYRIILIKDDAPSEWGDSAAEQDINSVLSQYGRTNL